MTHRWANTRIRRSWFGARPLASILVLPFLFGACGGSAAGTASPTVGQATKQTSGSTATPTATPSWTNYVLPDQRSARVLAVGTDGTVYVATFKATGLAQSDEQLVALGPGGTPRTGWTGPQIPAGKVVQTAVADTSGGLYIVIGSDFNSDAPVAKPITILHLDTAGVVTAGWPISIETSGLFGLILAGNDLCFEWANDSSTRTIERISPDGKRPAGWPLVLHSMALLGPIASNQGVVYVSTYAVAQPGGGAGPSYSASKITAYGADGQPVTGWHTPATAAQRVTYVVPIKSGLLEVSGSTLTNPAASDRDTLTWLNGDGTPTGATATAPKNGLSAGISVGPDGVPYVAWGFGGTNGSDGSVVDAIPGSVAIYGSDGKALPGWPVQLSGWPTNDFKNGGSLPVGPDGTIWVLDRANGFAVTVHALGPDGKPRLAQPLSITADNFTTAVVGGNNVLYIASRTGNTTTVVAVSEDHA